MTGEESPERKKPPGITLMQAAFPLWNRIYGPSLPPGERLRSFLQSTPPGCQLPIHQLLRLDRFQAYQNAVPLVGEQVETAVGALADVANAS